MRIVALVGSLALLAPSAALAQSIPGPPVIVNGIPVQTALAQLVANSVTAATPIAADTQLVTGARYAVDTTAPRALTLPPLAGLTPGQVVELWDETGMSPTNPITVSAAGSDQFIDFTGPLLVERPQSPIKFVVGAGATGWQVIS